MRTVASSWKAPWARFVLGASAATLAYPLAAGHPLVQGSLYIGLSAAVIVAMAEGVRLHRPRVSAGWFLLGAGVSLYLVANVIWYSATFFSNVPPRLLQAADVVYVLAYGAMVAAFVVMAWVRTAPVERTGAMIDSAIVAVGATLIAWVFLLAPANAQSDVPLAARAAALFYPVVDLVLAAIVLRVLFTPKNRSASFALLMLFVAAQTVADLAYATALLHGTFRLGGVLTAGWMLSYGCLGAATLHPSMPCLSEPCGDTSPMRLSWFRLVFVSLAVFVGPAVYFAGGDTGDEGVIVGAMTLGFVLGVARMAVFVCQLDSNEKQLARQARYDALTGLPNRLEFDERLATGTAEDRGVAVMLLDLDGFKKVNDGLGHAAGDALLVAVGRRIEGAVRPGDLVARFGGDEFTVLLESVSVDEARRVAQRVLDVFDSPVTIQGRQVVARASVGISVAAASRVSATAGVLLREADAAMYEAKRKGGQRYEVFSEDMHARVIDRLALECDLRDAGLGTELVLHYQPLVDLDDGHLTGFEALLRWRHPERGMLPPDQFIPVAEETGLIVPIGRWVLQEACRRSVAWGGGLTMNVNVSARQLEDEGFVADVAGALRTTQLEPSLLTLEVTETMIVVDEEATSRRLHELKALGVRIAVDDFGTGFSSLGHLRRFPIDELKIDRSFVSELGRGHDQGVAAAAIRLARSLNMDVVAEGIEDEEQLSELRRCSCRRGQGYLFWKPLEPDAVDVLLAHSGGLVLPPAPPLRVLVVDDDDLLRRALARALAAAGMDVLEASTGHDALAQADRATGIDAVLLDVGLPDLDGLAVGRTLKRKLGATLPVVHISGSRVEVADRVNALDGGADGYLIKPVPPVEVVATLRAVVRAGVDGFAGSAVRR